MERCLAEEHVNSIQLLTGRDVSCDKTEAFLYKVHIWGKLIFVSHFIVLVASRVATVLVNELLSQNFRIFLLF